MKRPLLCKLKLHCEAISHHPDWQIFLKLTGTLWWGCGNRPTHTAPACKTAWPFWKGIWQLLLKLPVHLLVALVILRLGLPREKLGGGFHFCHVGIGDRNVEVPCIFYIYIYIEIAKHREIERNIMTLMYRKQVAGADTSRTRLCLPGGPCSKSKENSRLIRNWLHEVKSERAPTLLSFAHFKE